MFFYFIGLYFNDVACTVCQFVVPLTLCRIKMYVLVYTVVIVVAVNNLFWSHFSTYVELYFICVF